MNAVLLVLLACLVAAAFDLRSRRIPNPLSIALAAAGLALSAFGGPHALLASLAAMSAVLLLGTLAHGAHWLGGGDIKLAAGAAAALGLPATVPFLLYTLLGGGLLAIVFLVVRDGVKDASLRVGAIATTGTGAVTAGRADTMPYAFAFVFGALMLVLAQTVAPFLRIPL